MSVRQAIRKVVCKIHSRRVDACVIFLLKVEAAVCAWICRRNYMRDLQRIRQKPADQKIKVLFIVSEPAKWKCQSLYETLKRSDKFEPLVGLSAWNIQSDMTDEELERHHEMSEEFFDRLGDSHVRTVYTNPRRFVDLRILNPDIVIYNEQWRPCKRQHPVTVSRFALTFFIPYYVPVFGNMFIHCEQPVEQLSYVYFTLNAEWEKLFVPYFSPRLSTAKFVSLGYPALDAFTSKSDRAQTKFTVIFAPHFAIPAKGNPDCDWQITQSTFDWSGKMILEYAKRHPEIDWVFKPHPLLREKIVLTGFMSRTEMDAYYAEWARLGTVCSSGDYQMLFMDSSLMLTDSGSFLAEYAATGHPLIHLWCPENNVVIPRPTQLLMDAFYRVSTPEELEKTLKLVIEERQDPKREERLRVVKELGLCDNDAAKNMVAYFEDLLGR